ncbi:MAG: MerR family transcriptional regulator [Desulfosarcina sp.]|jgi:DNA-binding transcriptional MerR regulator
MTFPTKNTFSIGDTAKMTGATQKQIQHWEAKGYISEAGRVVSGVRAYRRFTLGQVETISKIKEFLDEGFTLLAAAQKVTGKTFLTKEGQRNA